MNRLSERMRELADRIDNCEEFGLQELIDVLREASYQLDRAYAFLDFMNDLYLEEQRRNKEDKDDGST
jgi:hypothetical protein